MAQSEGFTPTGDFLIEECNMKTPLATMHYHNSYELYYVVKGERDYFIENRFFKAFNNRSLYKDVCNLNSLSNLL